MATNGKQPKPLQPLVSFNYKLIQERLLGLMMNVDRDLRKVVDQTPDHRMARAYIIMHLFARMAQNSWGSIVYLTAELPPDTNRKKSYVLTVPAINRQLMDMLFSLIYMLDDFPARVFDYDKAGWREGVEELQRYRTRYSGDPEWTNFLEGQKEMLAVAKSATGITPDEEKDHTKIQYWGTPTFLKEQQSASRPFLRWFYKWFYKDTSEQAHVSSSGLVALSPFLLAQVVGGENQELVESRIIHQYHYIHVSRMTFVVLAIMTELNYKFLLQNDDAVAYIWRVCAEYSMEARDLLDHRYSEMMQT